MSKYFAIVLILIVLFTLVGCNSNEVNTIEDNLNVEENSDTDFEKSGDMNFEKSGDIDFKESSNVNFDENGDINFKESGDIDLESQNINEENNIGSDVKMNLDINLVINGKTYSASLEENETAKSFLEMLPQEYDMKELNENEKYIYIDSTLPVNSYNPKHIEKGDIMLYGDNCIVVFYKSFDTSYSYTKIGNVENLPDLGNENITIRFEK